MSNNTAMRLLMVGIIGINAFCVYLVPKPMTISCLAISVMLFVFTFTKNSGWEE